MTVKSSMYDFHFRKEKGKTLFILNEILKKHNDATADLNQEHDQGRKRLFDQGECLVQYLVCNFEFTCELNIIFIKTA